MTKVKDPGEEGENTEVSMCGSHTDCLTVLPSHLPITRAATATRGSSFSFSTRSHASTQPAHLYSQE
jgi:hypothetical protein